MMHPALRALISVVLALDLFAIVYFGGTYILNGSLTGAPAAAAQVAIAAPAAAQAANQPAFDLASYVADPVKGQQVAAKCKACHTFENGGPNRVGPNLWGVIGRAAGSKDGFTYSEGMGSKKAEIAAWDKTKLFAFLENPKAYIPGTKMQFNGVKDPADRANLIAWLETLK